MGEAAAGERSAPRGDAVRTVAAALTTVAGVPYALIVLAAPLSLVAPQITATVAPSSPAALSRALTAAAGGVLAAAVVTAVLVGRRIPAQVVSLVGLVVLAGAALWTRSVHGLVSLALARGAQGVGAGVVLVACLAVGAALRGWGNRLLPGVWALAVVVASAVAPWASYRLPFTGIRDWREVLAPYPWLLAVALLGAAVGLVASLGSVAVDPTDPSEGYARRIGLPLSLPAGIAVAAQVVAPSLNTSGGAVTLYSLVLVTVLVVVALSGTNLARRAGWRRGAAPPVAAVAGAALGVGGSGAFTAVLFLGSGRWPLATSQVLPVVGGAAVAGGAAVLLGMSRPDRTGRRWAVGGLVAAAVGVACGWPTGIVPTTVGTVVASAGLGVALGAVVRAASAAAGWVAAGFVLAGTLATTHLGALRTSFTARAVPSTGGVDGSDFLRVGFVDAHRTWIVISVVLLVLAAALLTRLGRQTASPRTVEQAGHPDTVEEGSGRTEEPSRPAESSESTKGGAAETDETAVTAP